MKRSPLLLAVSPQGTGDVGAGRAVVVVDQRVDLKAFQVRQFGTGVIRHGITVAGIGRVFVGAHQVAGGWQPQTASRAAAQDYRFRLDHMEVGGAAIEAHHSVDRAIFVRQQRVQTRRLVMLTRARFNWRYRTFLMSCPSGIGST